MIIVIICIALMIIIMVSTLALYMNKDSYDVFIGMFMGILLLILWLVVDTRINPPMEPIDVYRGKTTLEITYRGSIPVDTVVVWKEEIK